MKETPAPINARAVGAQGAGKDAQPFTSSIASTRSG